ncbi:hypothetical protein [Actinokineospora sp. NBRC 105648]|uniref:hypothetical protein n=1 Tax=Actinokineospora sp. NBRC 105648 TaxID=3032206 RepID=UPI0024A107BB|nr:hypothetical protein [Actinokineospora sp. NBRC 105648]GLZ38233.1 hypothetical protein Acsp05_18570 [Actinokineospora sp. NBRC 105648]
MSQEGGSEQRTVAELLAKYGGSSGESAPRRRRRKPDDASETAPQAIIERVMSDSGKLLPIREDQGPHERTSHRQGRPQPSQQLPVPPQAQPRPPVELPPTERRGPVNGRVEQPPTEQHRPVVPPRPGQRPPRVDPVQPPTEQHRPVAPPPHAPQRVMPPVDQRPPAARLDQAEPHTEQLPRVPAEPGGPPRPLGEPGPAVDRTRPPEPDRPVGPPPGRLPPVPVDDRGPDPAEPPAGLAKAPNRAPLLPRRAPGTARGPQPSQQQPAQQQQPSQQLPAPPPDAPGPGRPGFGPQRGRPEFAGDSAETAVDASGPPPEFHEEFEGFDDKAAGRFTDYEAHDEFPAGRPPRGRAAGADLDDEFDDFDDRDERTDLDDRDDEDDRERAEEAEPAAEGSPGREWLIMAGQLALGVVGGAAVWLGFNWLWRVLPAAALIGALVVIVGLVLIVRKVRKAEDLQTTVLAVLVGLLATVSPAALLLLGR